MANSPNSSRMPLVLGVATITVALVLLVAGVVPSAIAFPLMGAGLGTLLFGLYNNHNARKR
ncbi:hypothetical protein ACIA49_18805 [Kribbella sp. NPDC051587]|uniref:hypothetical protein n=1 Tax=Kribbella sp. NPDC051587 TaxID=3364119 RepID=UPI0037B86A62